MSKSFSQLVNETLKPASVKKSVKKSLSVSKPAQKKKVVNETVLMSANTKTKVAPKKEVKVNTLAEDIFSIYPTSKKKNDLLSFGDLAFIFEEKDEEEEDVKKEKDKSENDTEESDEDVGSDDEKEEDDDKDTNSEDTMDEEDEEPEVEKKDCEKDDTCDDEEKLSDSPENEDDEDNNEEEDAGEDEDLSWDDIADNKKPEETDEKEVDEEDETPKTEDDGEVTSKKFKEVTLTIPALIKVLNSVSAKSPDRITVNSMVMSMLHFCGSGSCVIDVDNLEEIKYLMHGMEYHKEEKDEEPEDEQGVENNSDSDSSIYATHDVINDKEPKNGKKLSSGKFLLDNKKMDESDSFSYDIESVFESYSNKDIENIKRRSGLKFKILG